MLLRERQSSTVSAGAAGRGGAGRRSPGSPSGPSRPGPRRSRRALRRGIAGAVAGALVMLGFTLVWGPRTASLGLSGSERGGIIGSIVGGSSGGALSSAPGTCLTWNSADASDVEQVECSAPHLFESVGAVTAAAPPGAPFPGDDGWQKLVTSQCAPLARSYLAGKLDPSGRYHAGALKPTQSAWGSGDRTMRCGLEAPGRSGALFTSTGKVADRDQAVVFDPGTCLGLAGKDVADPVDCASTHAAEVAGTVDLGKQFPRDHPSVDDQDDYLQPTCAKVAADRLGGQQKLDATKLTVYWTNLSADSWNAGTRRVDCNLGSLLGDGSGFAPLTGAATDRVTIGGSAAAPAVPPLAPGAPAGRAATGGLAGPAPTDGPQTESGGNTAGDNNPGSASPTAGPPSTSPTPASPVGGETSKLPLPSLPVPLPGR